VAASRRRQNPTPHRNYEITDEGRVKMPCVLICSDPHKKTGQSKLVRGVPFRALSSDLATGSCWFGHLAGFWRLVARLVQTHVRSVCVSSVRQRSNFI